MSGLSGVQLHLVSDVQTAGELMTWLGERRDVLAIDTETTGFNPYKGKLRLVQLGDACHGWSIPWELWGGVALEALDRYDGPIVFHNSAFDVRWLQQHTSWTVPWQRTHDTMIMAQIDDPTQSAALKNLATRLIDKRANAGEALLHEAFANNKWTWETVPIDYEPYWAYGALDSVLTAQLYALLRTDKKYPRVYELEMATRRVVSQMEDNGSPIDVDYCAVKYEQLLQYVDKMKAWGQVELGISIGSPGALVRWFKDNGASIDKLTAGGSPSVDKSVLKSLVADPPNARVAAVAQSVLDTRKADKLAGTYFRNFLDRHTDGVLHPSIKTLGARTGRMSMTDPALQTLPKGEATVRDAFIPREGHVLISCDYSQIEMRLMAHFSNDEALREAFRRADSTGGDFFVELGRDIYEDPTFTKTDKRRGLVKNTLYGKIYGAGVTKMAETAGVAEAVMQAVVNGVDGRYPGLKQFQKTVEDTGSRREYDEGVGYIFTPTGRRLPADKGRVYSLVNYLLRPRCGDSQAGARPARLGRLRREHAAACTRRSDLLGAARGRRAGTQGHPCGDGCRRRLVLGSAAR